MFRPNLCKIKIGVLNSVSQQIFAVFFLMLIKWTWSFNVDLETVLIHQAQPKSHFGFSVSLHRTQGKSWLLIGAPTAQTSQPGVTRGGAVYKCDTDRANYCEQILFDKSGSVEKLHGNTNEYLENKTNQWFGATLYSAGENGPIVACAPRYALSSSEFRRRSPVGTCWKARGSFSGFEEYSPCRNMTLRYYRQESCQAGFSAVVTKDGQWLYVGAVGSWYWQGQVFSQNLFDKQFLYSTPEGPPEEDDSYLGFSTAVGEFTGDNIVDLAIGMPRGYKLKGKVVFLTTFLKNLLNLTGDQLGSYFGYAICVADVNGDRLDDVMVGAPLYANFDSENSYEEGRVYIFYQNSEQQMVNKSYLDGTYSRGRFGQALTSLGDINKDGFQDFAVGAPYAGNKERGVVYIYHGSRGIMKSTKPSQVITAESVGDPGLSTFGFSLSGGMDMDENSYPDLLVGAYDSNRAIFFRSRPVVNLFANLEIDPNTINLDEKGCSLSDRTEVSCVVITVCLQYSGIGVPSYLRIKLKTQLDVDLQQNPRVFFLEREKINRNVYDIFIRKESKSCKNVYAYIEDQIRDKLTPITVEVTVDLLYSEPYRKVLKPILNKALPQQLTRQVSIQKNCGKDNVCIPDLSVELSLNMEEYFIGSKKRIELSVNVTNRGEDAFETMLYLEIPQEVNYVNINRTNTNEPMSCSPFFRTSGNSILICDVGNPFPAGNELIFTVLLEPAQVAPNIQELNFNATVNSTNPEPNSTLTDNYGVIKLPATFKIKMIVHGISFPESVTYNKSTILPDDQIKTESDIGPEVLHVYEIINKGPSTIQEAKIDIIWPAYTLYRKHLLYLLDNPKVRGKARCQDVPDINILSLQKERKKNGNREELMARTFTKNTINTTSTEEGNLLRRNKRQEQVQNSSLDETNSGTKLYTRIYCTIFNLNENDQVVVTIRSRLWMATVDKMGLSQVQVSSKLIARITALPYDDLDVDRIPQKDFMVTTKVYPDIVKEHGVFLWWIIVATAGGILLLALLVWGLVKVGFFKRRRPPDKQLLHSLDDVNGYTFNCRDEAL